MRNDRTRSDRLIRAYKHGWPCWAVHALILRKLRGGFFRVRAQGIDPLRATIDREPGGTLFLANHSCWWDLFLAHYLNSIIPVDGYGMMEHFNMLRFGFFRRIGAFSVDRTDPVAVRASIDYAAELLRGPRAGVWIFPQGRMVGNDIRPLGFQPGLRALVRRAGRLRICPVALRYEFWQDELPEAFVRFGEPATVDRSALATILPTWEDRLTAELETLRTDVVAQATDRFSILLEGSGSINDGYAKLRARFFGTTPGVPGA
ncbi:lysophospholipid acyltransferase family protein [soil metagenome]